ncbi:MAG: hypothetical protein ACLT2E_00585 [Alphaproteobacteria bacterium]
MMKVLPWFALLFACTAVPADAHLTFAGTPKSDLFSSARLIDTNQSQSLEAVSTADGNLRLPSYKLAGVYFITGSNGQTFDNEAKDNDFTDPTGDNCKRLGFAVTSCASGLFNRACPYNDRIYDKCCEASYTYEASNCPAPRKLSSETCGGKHRCYCDTAQYPFASCNDPQIKGNACTDDGGTRYATCVCPNPVSTPYGCETYYAAPCGSVCKKAYADNCRNRTAVQTPYGCEKYFADCSSKCEKAYSDNCRNRNAVSAPYGCQQVYGDCQSKCEVAYPDNCHNRTAAIASCPANATCSYFADCAAKIQSWTCNSGYKQSGNSCVVEYNCSQQYSYYKNINDKMQFALLRNSCKGNYTTWSTIAPIKMGETCSQFGMRMHSEITAHNNKCPSNRISPIRSPMCSSCCDGGRNGIGALYMCREDDMGMGGIR